MKKNLILCFSSLRPVEFTSDQLVDREKNYDLALECLLKSIPNNWDIIYNDNTLNDLSELTNQSLKDRLKDSRIKVMLHKNNEGSINKGAGEHDMCRKSFSRINPEEYNWVVYFTARHLILNPWYFVNLENISEYECVMSNPVFYFLNNYSKLESEKGQYNDMIFSMKSEIFSKFVDSIDVQNLKDKHKNSERHLYEFIQEKGLKTIELESLGILRRDKNLGWHLI